MKTFSLAAFWFLSATAFAQDFDKTRKEFKEAVLAMNESAVASAADKLVSSDNTGAVDALLDGYSLTAAQLKQLWAEKVRWIREADANSDIEWINGPTGSTPAAGSMNRYLKLQEAQKEGQRVEEKIMRIESVKRRIVSALASFKSDAAVKSLVGKMKLDSNWDRRAGIAEALGQIEHADAVPALVDRMKGDSEAGVKVACLDAIRAKKAATPEVVSAVCDQLRSDFWQVKYSAAITLKALGSRDAIEPLIDTLKGVDGRLRHDINDVLVALSGVDKHGDHAAWRAWFDTNKEAVVGGGYKPKDEEKPNAGNGRGTTFYGIPVKSKNVVFVIDCSGSMMWESEWAVPTDVATGSGGGADPYPKPNGNRKIDIARWQLARCVAGIPDQTEFNIIFFSSGFEVMSEKMVKMTAATRKQALAFVDRLQPEGGTNIFDPMEKAFTFTGSGDKLAKQSIDTIFLLTDGMPNQGQIPDASGILAKLKEMNKVKKITVNTIGVFSSNPPVPVQANEKEEGEKFLKQMSDDHGGVFVNASTGNKSGGGRKK